MPVILNRAHRSLAAFFCSSVGIQGITRMVESWRPLRMAAFSSSEVMDSIHFEFSRGPTLRGRRFGIPRTRLETFATRERRDPEGPGSSAWMEG